MISIEIPCLGKFVPGSKTRETFEYPQLQVTYAQCTNVSTKAIARLPVTWV
jgi:L-lactate permease